MIYTTFILLKYNLFKCHRIKAECYTIILKSISIKFCMRKGNYIYFTLNEFTRNGLVVTLSCNQNVGVIDICCSLLHFYIQLNL